jgi:ferric-dicitrate binding protein FerR (iron transport regulator)
MTGVAPLPDKKMENLFQDDTFLARWLENKLSPEELEALQQREDYADFAQIIEDLKKVEWEEFSTTIAWQRFQQKLNAAKTAEPQTQDPLQPPAQTETHETEEVPQTPATTQTLTTGEPAELEEAPVISEEKQTVTPIRRLFPWKTIAGIAAAVVLTLFAWWQFSDDYRVPSASTSLSTKAGEKKELNLPDGSSVHLNALSSLGYSPEKWATNRYVVLEGEAYFTTKKGKRFTVHTELGQVEVVGTVFNVFARDTLLEVQCLNGKVQVSDPESLKVLLKSGEQVNVLNGRLQKRQGLAFTPVWFKGTSAFRSAPLERVFAEMQRQYGVVVVADSIGGRTFSGKFIHDDLNKALKMVCDPMRLQYEARQDTVRIFHK